MIEQKLFSKLISEFLSEHYPAFSSTIKYSDDGSFECSLRSPSNHFALWVATYNAEVTIGLEDPNSDSGIHTHISCYDEEDIIQTSSQLSEMISDIMGDKLILIHHGRKGYDWCNDLTDLMIKKKPSDEIRAYSWSDDKIQLL